MVSFYNPNTCPTCGYKTYSSFDKETHEEEGLAACLTYIRSEFSERVSDLESKVKQLENQVFTLESDK